MPRLIDKLGFSLSIRPPENEYGVREYGAKHLYTIFGNLFPANLTVRTGMAFFNRQDIIEEKDPLFEPWREVAVLDNSLTKVRFYLF